MTNDFTFIYGLVDPITDELRYIGKSNNPAQRLNQHMGCKNSLKAEWITALRELGKVPELVIIEQVLKTAWRESEIFWINYFKYIGCQLTNASDGGDGPAERSAWFRNRMSEVHSGRIVSDEEKAKRRETIRINRANGKKSRWAKRTGWHHTPETRAKIAKANAERRKWETENGITRISPLKGRRLTQEHKDKIGKATASRKGKVTAETKKKTGDTLRGRKITESARQNRILAALLRKQKKLLSE